MKRKLNYAHVFLYLPTRDRYDFECSKGESLERELQSVKHRLHCSLEQEKLLTKEAEDQMAATKNNHEAMNKQMLQLTEQKKKLSIDLKAAQVETVSLQRDIQTVK